MQIARAQLAFVTNCTAVLRNLATPPTHLRVDACAILTVNSVRSFVARFNGGSKYNKWHPVNQLVRQLIAKI